MPKKETKLTPEQMMKRAKVIAMTLGGEIIDGFKD